MSDSITDGTVNLTPAQKRICERVVNVFETGSVRGNYAAISIFEDGPNNIRQITYGRSQTTEYGNLRELVQMYADAGGRFSDQLRDYVPRIGRVALVDDAPFKDLLRRAGGEDQVMRDTQDTFFDRRYFQPAVHWAGQNGFARALSVLVIYDSFVHSGGILDLLRARFPELTPARGGNEQTWIREYVDVRNQWLLTHPRPAVRSSAYRTRDLAREIARGNWDLSLLPIMANGVPVSDDAAGSQAAVAADVVPFFGNVGVAAAAAGGQMFTLRRGTHYHATVTLGFFEQFASNETIAGMLTSYGFTEVQVTGSGGQRAGDALWPGPDRQVQLPSQITSLQVSAAAPAAPQSIGEFDAAPGFAAAVASVSDAQSLGVAAPSIIRAEGGVAMGNVFSTQSIPTHHEGLLIVKMREEAPSAALADPGATAMVAMSAPPPTTPGLSALSYYERAGLIRRVTPLRRDDEPPAPGHGMSALSILAATASDAAPKAQAGRGISFIQMAPGQDTRQLHAELARDSNVENVSQVPIRYLAARPTRGAPASAPNATIAAVPPALPIMWNLAKISWEQARSRPCFRDADAIRVAVLDTGVDLNHPELRGQVEAYDWKELDVARPVSDKDIIGHGTHVSGTIAAIISGAIGVKGICKCRLSVWKIFDDEPTYVPGLGSFVYFVNPEMYHRALAACVETPVDVMNLSIGGRAAPSPVEQQLFDQLLEAGVTVCAAMGNDRQYGSPISYPAAIPGVIAVGATALDDTIASFSNRGNHIALTAPGKAIWSTLPTYAGQTAFGATIGPGGTAQQGKPVRRETDYDAWDGTSMATPHVTAAAALLQAKNAGNGRMKPTDVRDALMRSADKVADMNGSGFSTDYGAGRLNLYKLLQ